MSITAIGGRSPARSVRPRSRTRASRTAKPSRLRARRRRAAKAMSPEASEHRRAASSRRRRARRATWSEGGSNKAARWSGIRIVGAVVDGAGDGRIETFRSAGKRPARSSHVPGRPLDPGRGSWTGAESPAARWRGVSQPSGSGMERSPRCRPVTPRQGGGWRRPPGPRPRATPASPPPSRTRPVAHPGRPPGRPGALDPPPRDRHTRGHRRRARRPLRARSGGDRHGTPAPSKRP